MDVAVYYLEAKLRGTLNIPLPRADQDGDDDDVDDDNDDDDGGGGGGGDTCRLILFFANLKPSYLLDTSKSITHDLDADP
ncbi:hypothetical protein PoB_000155400 [Plakobranchus ocellatus]|uniref:Uncharacterized protein n=1 Tax=Plakobranchus ocellatus TaxID=259542 RepID=A0AAV3XYN0_9GAST|nr:hypothetical protein PoB_000155400 [Plakobranchus ocellatus]